MLTEGVVVSEVSLRRRRGIEGRGLSLQDSHLIPACALASASMAAFESFEGG